MSTILTFILVDGHVNFLWSSLFHSWDKFSDNRVVLVDEVICDHS